MRTWGGDGDMEERTWAAHESTEMGVWGSLWGSFVLLKRLIVDHEETQMTSLTYILKNMYHILFNIEK